MVPLGAAEAPGPVTGLAMPRLQMNRILQLTHFTAPFHITHRITCLAHDNRQPALGSLPVAPQG